MNEPAPDDDGVDLRCCLFLTGVDGASRGSYRPEGYELHLEPDRVDRHHLTHLHEIHHKALNDDTSWGTALHVTARHPMWSGDLFPHLLGACRIIHESFASFMSVSLASTRHDTIDEAMDAYPEYQVHARRLNDLLANVPAGHRQDLAATGIARFCMSAPVLDLLAHHDAEPVRMAAIRTLDRPDERFRRIRSADPESIVRAVIRADEEFRRSCGVEIDQLELSETDATLDHAWSVWEDRFVAGLIAAHPRLRSVPIPEPNAHLPSAINLVASLAATGIHIDLPIRSEDDRPVGDAESVQRILGAVAFPLHQPPWRAVMVRIGDRVDPGAVADLAAGTTPGRPSLVVCGRVVEQILDDYDLTDPDRADVQAVAPHPLFAVRAPIDTSDGDAVFHGLVPDPAGYQELVASWAERGQIVNLLTSSCFRTTDWQPLWRPALAAHPTVVLVDTGMLGMTGPGRLLGDGNRIWANYVDHGHPFLRSLVWHVDQHPHVMMAIGDDLSIQLVAGQLTDLVGDRLSMSDSDWTQWRDPLGAAFASVIGTHSTLHFSGTGRAQPIRGGRP